jgi:hypothetical protein
MSRTLTAADILPLEAYVKVRLDKRKALVELKKNRQIQVGPHVTVTFECWDTMWYQVQEMLYIEKGGDAQLTDELAAYGPMVPNGRELVATMMFEIEDAARRARILATLGGVEDTVSLAFAGETVTARPEGDVARTDAEGKTSSVHFLHFPFTAGQIAKFKAAGSQVTFAISHPNYHHLAVLPESVRTALAADFDAA